MSTKPTHKKITIRKYGAKLLGGAEAERVATSVLLSMNRLWNNLVHIERDVSDQWREIVNSSDAELADLVEQERLGVEALEALQTERNRERAKARRKTVPASADYAARIRAQAFALKNLRTNMKALRARAKLAAKPRLRRLRLTGASA